MYKNHYLTSLIISLLLEMSFPAFADTTTAIPKNKEPVECTDSQNYDQIDCQRALDMIQWKNNQDKLPDNQRKTNAGLGEDLLIEKATGYRIGTHKVQVLGQKNVGVALKVGTINDTKVFLVSGVCSLDNPIEILKNTVDFTMLYVECDSMNKANNTFSYYSFDKQSKRLVVLLQGEGRSGGKEPTQTFTNGLYKFIWHNYQTLDNGKYFSVYYDYKISDTTESGVKCTRVWDKDAGCDIETVPALVPGKYKILD
jgi:hypothetical protein